MNRTYLLLKEIQKNPYIYVGKLSLERLYAFISGYQYSERERDPEYRSCLDGFNEFVSEHYGLHTDHNWANMIEFFSTSEQEAFNTFYTLLEEFIQNKGE